MEHLLVHNRLRKQRIRIVSTLLIAVIMLAYLMLPTTALAATIPNAPSDLLVVATSETTIYLSWQDNSDDETGFKIERKTGTGDFILIRTTIADVTTYTDVGLVENISYTYRVRAYNAAGNSEYSNTASAVPVELTLYEYWNTGEDAFATVYGDDWFAQTFDVDEDVTYTASRVKLKLYRVGTPGKVYVMIRETNGTLGVGYLDGDAFTDDPGGDWYTFSIVPVANLQMQASETYAVTLAADGDAANYVCWLYDSDNGYADGKYYSSDDGGESWTPTAANDFMFEVWGVPSLEIFDVKVFSSVIEDGDWLFCTLYNCAVSPAYPAEDVTKYFDLYLWDNDADVPVGKIKLPAWGYKPAALYLSADMTADLTWGSGYYSINIEGNAVEWDTPPLVEHYMASMDWVGVDLFKLDEWVRETAQVLESYYNVDFYTETVGDTTLPEGEGVLTPTGSEVFLIGIPGLDTLRPYLFQATINEPEITNPESNPVYEETVTWQEQVGPKVTAIFTTWGELVNLDGRIFGGTMIFFVFVGFVGVGVMSQGIPSIVAVVVALPVALGAWYFRLWPMQLAAAMSIIVAMVMAWIFWLRST